MVISTQYQLNQPNQSWLTPLRNHINSIDVNNFKLATTICKLIPSSCPFERDIILFGHTLFHIPALCHFNPVYEELIMLRFRALTYLSEQQ